MYGALSHEVKYMIIMIIVRDKMHFLYDKLVSNYFILPIDVLIDRLYDSSPQKHRLIMIIDKHVHGCIIHDP